MKICNSYLRGRMRENLIDHPPASKCCKRCKQTLPVEMFVPNSRCKDGYTSYCTGCWKFVTGARAKCDSIVLEPDTYITEANPPRTLVESFLDAERRRAALQRQGRPRRGRPRRDRFDGLVPMPD